MPQGIQIMDANGNLVLDTNDRFLGGVVEFSTGKQNGSYTATPPAGQTVEFVYTVITFWLASGQASRWPFFSVNGNQITWSFITQVPEADRHAVNVSVVMY